jgi:type IV secretion system protein VirD4
MNATKILWGQVILVCVVVLIPLGRDRADGLAARLSAGAPPTLVHAARLAAYTPAAFFWWWFVYDAYARQSSLKALISRAQAESPLSWPL